MYNALTNVKAHSQNELVKEEREMNNKIEKLVHTLKQSYNGYPWYGDSLIKKMSTVNFNIVNKTLPNSNNSIATIIQHMINWRVFVIEKMIGNQTIDINIVSKKDWANIIINTELEWTVLIKKLSSTQNKIIEILEEQMVNTDLNNKVTGEDYSLEYLLNGIIQHDIYHAGQIGLLHAHLKTI